MRWSLKVQSCASRPHEPRVGRRPAPAIVVPAGVGLRVHAPRLDGT
jgi:hypothetical protein